MTTGMFVALEGAAACTFTASAALAARRCRVPLDARVRMPVLIFVSSVLAAPIVFAFRQSGEGMTFAILAAAIAVSAASDVATGLIFDAVTLPALGLLLLCAALYGYSAQAFAGAACAGGAIVLIYAATRGRGIGLGDAKLAACIGAALGVRGSLYALGIAFVSGALFGLAALAVRRIGRGTQIRFAPYLAAGTFAAVLWLPA